MIFAAIRGYWRRRGWLAWHTAALNRIPGEDVPALHKLMGTKPPPPKPPMSADEIERNMVAWEAATAHLAESEE